MIDFPTFIVDTCSLYWYLSDSERLSRNAYQQFVIADEGRAILLIPHIVLAELYYLLRKQNSPIDFCAAVSLLNQTRQYQIESHTLEDILAFDQLSVITEMHDRLIAAMALRLKVPIITCDPNIKACSQLEIIW